MINDCIRLVKTLKTTNLAGSKRNATISTQLWRPNTTVIYNKLSAFTINKHFTVKPTLSVYT